MAAEGAAAAAAGTITIGGELTVNRMGFGAMRLTGSGIWGEPDSREEAKRVLRRAVELGVQFIDTADSYGPHVSETLIGEALAPYTGGVVVATKGGHVRPGPGLWTVDGRPDHLKRAIEGSLQRLRLEQIPLYQFHRPDPAIPIEDSVGALRELQEEGKVRFIGVSNVDVKLLRRAQREAQIVSVQNRYNPLDRASEDVLRVCEEEGLVFLPWGPIGQGRLGHRELVAMAEARGVSPSQLALAWLLAHSHALLPIPGTCSVAHLEENVAAAKLRLTRQETDRIDALAEGATRHGA
jgi:pyridoxine 4-dehydrogenase